MDALAIIFTVSWLLAFLLAACGSIREYFQ